MDLLGCILTRESPEGRTSGCIVETEAYRPEDPACHAYNGPTMRNRTIFGVPGLAYVYLSYGMHHLLNVVCEDEGVGSAVLIRALRPIEGKEIMTLRRGRATDLCNGPGKLSQAMAVTLHENGHVITDGALNIAWGGQPEGEIVSTTRIGISRGTELPWRYLVLDDPNVSASPKRLYARGLRRSM